MKLTISSALYVEVKRFMKCFNFPGQMHLCPIKATIQLRPTFYYYDIVFGGDKRKKGQAEESTARQPRAVQVYAEGGF
jgi:hypothetical protein